MNQNKIILILVTVPLFLSTGIIEKLNIIDDEWRHTPITYLRDSSDLPTYEVRMTYTGYTTLYGDIPDCPVRKNGTVVLSGLLSGEENVDRDDPILYTGVLQLSIDIDICSATRLANGEDKLCGLTVKGSGPVKTELEIDTSVGYGYIKIHHDPSLGVFTKSVAGCDNNQASEERNLVPNETIASIFNGTELPMLTERTLRTRRFPERDGVVVDVRKVR